MFRGVGVDFPMFARFLFGLPRVGLAVLLKYVVLRYGGVVCIRETDS